MVIKFLYGGESPEPGAGKFQKGDERDIPEGAARRFIERGVAVEVKTQKLAVKGADKKEVKDNGRD